MKSGKLGWKELVEIFTLVAVVGGFIAVVQELRQTQLSLNAQAYQARALDSIDQNFRMLEDTELLELLTQMRSGQTDIDSLTPLERARLTRFMFIRRTDTDNEHYQYATGFLDTDFYFTTTVREIKETAPLWRMLGIREPRESFRDEVDRILADPSITGDFSQAGR